MRKQLGDERWDVAEFISQEMKRNEDYEEAPMKVESEAEFGGIKDEED